MSSVNTFRCCICGKEFIGYGNSPYPIKDTGECCEVCNYTKVIPQRQQLAIRRRYESATV